MRIAVLGVDLGKNVCSLVGLNASGAVVLRRRAKRETVIALAAKALVRTGLTLSHNLPADCSNDRADECSTWTNSSKAAISIA